MMQEPQEPLNIGKMIFEHTGDSHELDFGQFGHLELPQWQPVHIGSFAVDLSPTRHVVFMLLAASIVLVIMLITARGLARARRENRAPSGFANAMEAMVLFVREEIAIVNIGHEMGPRYAPLIMTFFFFILTCNLLGLLPFGASPTGNMAVTGALALVAFAAIEIGGLIKLGPKGYLSTIWMHVDGLPPVGAFLISVFMVPIEILSKMVKPFALMVRLFGNITAGHFVILAMFGIVFTFGHFGIASYGLGIFTALFVTGVMVLELLVALLQAYVFATLSAVFIGLMQHEH